MHEGIKAQFHFDVTVWEIVDGIWRLKAHRTAHNLITTVGANTIINACFGSGLASPSWFVGMSKGASPGTFAITDVMASHPGWTEVVSTDIVQTARQAFVGGTISGGSISNSASPATYQIAASATPTLQGCFIADSGTLGGTTGNLYSEANFVEGATATAPGNVIQIIATLTAVAG